MEVTVRVSLVVPASSTIKQVKRAFVQKLGQTKGASKIKLLKQLEDRLATCEDSDYLDLRYDMFAEGLNVSETAETVEPDRTGPSGSSKAQVPLSH